MSVSSKAFRATLFSYLNRYFDHIYVLTLTRSHARQAQVSKVLDGLNWSFFFGTDKHELQSEKVRSDGTYDEAMHLRTKRTHRGMNLGEIACALSHKGIYQDIVEKGYQRALVLEDDVMPVDSALTNFTHLVKELPDNWDLLMLGYYGEKPPGVRFALQSQLYRLFRRYRLFNWHKVSESWIDNLQMKHYSPHWYASGKVLGSHAYGLNIDTAKKFIAYQTPVHLQADRVFNYYQAAQPLQVYALKSPLFALSELSRQSDIQPSN